MEPMVYTMVLVGLRGSTISNRASTTAIVHQLVPSDLRLPCMFAVYALDRRLSLPGTTNYVRSRADCQSHSLHLDEKELICSTVGVISFLRRMEVCIEIVTSPTNRRGHSTHMLQDCLL